MTRRAGDWHLLGYDDDPVPANEWDVDTIHDEMRDRANDAGDMRDMLQRLADLDGWRGETAEAFAEKADEVVGDLGKVQDRYEKVTDALKTWKSEVEDARDATWRALKDAEVADEAIRDNPPHNGSGEAPDGQDAQDSRRESAETDLANARTAMNNAMEAFENAAERAKNEIEDAADVWDDGWWGDFKGWIRDNADVIAAIVQVLEIVAFILGAIIIVVAIVASAPFALIAAAVAVGVLIVAGKALLAAGDTGKADWGDVAWAAVGVILTVAGGAIFKMAKSGVTALRSAMSSRLSTQAMSSAFQRLSGGNLQSVVSALKIQNPNNPLFKWAQGVASGVDDAGAAVAKSFDDIANVKPSHLSSVLMQNRKLAQLQTQLGQLSKLGSTADELAQLAQIQKQILAGVTVNTGSTGIFGKDLPNNIGNLDFFTNPPWSTQPVN